MVLHHGRRANELQAVGQSGKPTMNQKNPILHHKNPHLTEKTTSFVPKNLTDFFQKTCEGYKSLLKKIPHFLPKNPQSY